MDHGPPYRGKQENLTSPCQIWPEGKFFPEYGPKPKVIAHVVFKNGFYLGETHCHHHPVNCAKCALRTSRRSRNWKAILFFYSAEMQQWVRWLHPTTTWLEAPLQVPQIAQGKRHCSAGAVFFSRQGPQTARVYWIYGLQSISAFWKGDRALWRVYLRSWPEEPCLVLVHLLWWVLHTAAPLCFTQHFLWCTELVKVLSAT